MKTEIRFCVNFDEKFGILHKRELLKYRNIILQFK